MLFVLSISIHPNNLDRPFFTVEKNFRWIYAVSSNSSLLQSFRFKILQYTDLELLNYLDIEIIPYEILNENEIENNFRNPYTLDKIYVEGIVNCRHNRPTNLSYTYDEFTPDKWDI